MRIGIFSKLEMAGGSEFRCAEMANGIARYSDHKSILISEKDIPSRICEYLHPDVEMRTNIFRGNTRDIESFYGLDSLLIINTDSKSFAHYDYWSGKSERHGVSIDLTRVKQMVFLFNLWTV